MNLHDYDLIVINSSGGKDSQTALRQTVKLADAQDYPREQLVVVHADLRRVEWKDAKKFAKLQAEHYGIRFEWITREKGDLLDQVAARKKWPDSKNRYCTSDQKRDQIQKVIVKEGRAIAQDKIRVLNVMGMRAEESPARAKKQPFSINKRSTTQTRHVDDYLIIHEWLETEVWADIRESNVPYHWAYDKGMSRLSCVFCIFASQADLMIAGRHNRELLETYVELEEEIGHDFKNGFKIAEILKAVEAEEATQEPTAEPTPRVAVTQPTGRQGNTFTGQRTDLVPCVILAETYNQYHRVRMVQVALLEDCGSYLYGHVLTVAAEALDSG